MTKTIPPKIEDAISKTETHPQAVSEAGFVICVPILTAAELDKDGHIIKDKDAKKLATMTKPYPGIVSHNSILVEDGLRLGLARVKRNDDKNRTESHLGGVFLKDRAAADAEIKRLTALGWTKEDQE